MTSAPVGVFDSGVGGLTVARAILDQLPHEQVRYLADTAHLPYGPKPIAQVRAYALECLDRLVDDGVKLLIIACNSASAACLHDARERYSVPVVEVIRPAVRRAMRVSPMRAQTMASATRRMAVRRSIMTPPRPGDQSPKARATRSLVSQLRPNRWKPVRRRPPAVESAGWTGADPRSGPPAAPRRRSTTGS